MDIGTTDPRLVGFPVLNDVIGEFAHAAQARPTRGSDAVPSAA